MIDSLQTMGVPLLVLELGDFMEKDHWMGAVFNPFILDRMEAEGVAAMGPGVRELSDWLGFQKLMSGRSIGIVSSNVRIRHGGSFVPIAQRSTVVEVNRVRVGLLAVMGAEEYEKVTPPAAILFELQDPQEAIAELAGEMRERCDIVVVMACMNDRSAAALAHQLQGVDVVLGGHSSIASDRPLLRGDDVIVNRSGLQGQYLSTTRLIISPDGEIIDWGGRNYLLDRRFPSDPEVEAIADKIEKQGIEARSEGWRAARAREREQDSRGGPPYLGVETCRSCHGEQYRQWVGTPHARAYETLIREGKTMDAASVRRRVTGFDSPGGYAFGRAKPDLRNVQCEVCHGPGKEHARGGDAPIVRRAVCLSCHAPDLSSDWDFEKAIAVVRH